MPLRNKGSGGASFTEEGGGEEGDSLISRKGKSRMKEVLLTIEGKGGGAALAPTRPEGGGGKKEEEDVCLINITERGTSQCKRAEERQ